MSAPTAERAADGVRTLIERLEGRIRGYGERALVAFSGGVDSSVVLALAARALGPARVEAVTAISPSYPAGEQWRAPGTNDNDTSSVQSVTSAAQGFLAAKTNEDLGLEAHEQGAVQTTQFTVENIRFATASDVSLAAAEAYFTGGGPRVTLYLRHDSGSVNRYSWMFLIGSALGLAIHVPFLDRAERTRKQILTGGTAPPWYGPA